MNIRQLFCLTMALILNKHHKLYLYVCVCVCVCVFVCVCVCLYWMCKIAIDKLEFVVIMCDMILIITDWVPWEQTVCTSMW